MNRNMERFLQPANGDGRHIADNESPKNNFAGNEEKELQNLARFHTQCLQNADGLNLFQDDNEEVGQHRNQTNNAGNDNQHDDIGVEKGYPLEDFRIDFLDGFGFELVGYRVGDG